MWSIASLPCRASPWKGLRQSSHALSSLVNTYMYGKARSRIPTPGCARRAGGRVRGAVRGKPAGLVPHGRAGDARAPAHGLRGRAHGALHGRGRRMQGQLLRSARAGRGPGRRRVDGADVPCARRWLYGARTGRVHSMQVVHSGVRFGARRAHVKVGCVQTLCVWSSWTCLLPQNRGCAMSAAFVPLLCRFAACCMLRQVINLHRLWQGIVLARLGQY